MRFTYVVNLKDYWAAERLRRRRKPFLRFVRFFVLWCSPLIGFRVVLYSVHKSHLVGERPSIIGLILLEAICFFPLLWEYYITRTSFRLLSSKTGSGAIIDINDNGMLATWAGEKEQILSWDRIVSFDSDDRIAIFYTQKGSFFFSMRMFSPTQRAELNDLVARHVKKRI